MSDQANSNRPRETVVMASLEHIISAATTIIAEAEGAEALVQNDGWVTNELERRTILNRAMNIRTARHEIDVALSELELALGPHIME